VSDRTNPQAWNPYSYVLNNPLKYTDPSGNQEELTEAAQTLSQIPIPGLKWLALALFATACLVEAYNAQESFDFIDAPFHFIVDVWDTVTGWFQETFSSTTDPYYHASLGTTTPIYSDIPYPTEVYPVESDIISSGGTITFSKIGGVDSSEDRNWRDDRPLTRNDIDKLERSGYDVHELKGRTGGGRLDLFKDKNGNVYLKPKNGQGPGEDLGINLNIDAW
jgi:hypothetical protein